MWWGTDDALCARQFSWAVNAGIAPAPPVESSRPSNEAEAPKEAV